MVGRSASFGRPGSETFRAGRFFFKNDFGAGSKVGLVKGNDGSTASPERHPLPAEDRPLLDQEGIIRSAAPRAPEGRSTDRRAAFLF
jgi:hypothetical protein